MHASLDLVLGRAWVGSAPNGQHERQTFGLRLGMGGLVESARDRSGVAGTTPLGFVYFRPAIVSGRRLIGEGHAIGYVGPVRVIVEGAVADEGRSKDDDGNPDTPRVEQQSLQSYGISAEVSWTAIGRLRTVGEPPHPEEGRWRGGAIELAARYDGLWLARGADDIPGGGSQGGALGIKWWPTEFLRASTSWTFTRYDTPPIEEPNRTISWGLQSRVGFHWGQ